MRSIFYYWKTHFIDRAYNNMSFARSQSSTGSVRDAPGMMHNAGSMHKTSPLLGSMTTSDQSPATRTGLNYLFLRKLLISILEPIARFDAPGAEILVYTGRRTKNSRKKILTQSHANYRIPFNSADINTVLVFSEYYFRFAKTF